ncbi:MAG: DUF3881 family protein, partial [Lachnospiraceae bacterium]|nr:DUF3881 family protein [Lachnospiraceae bacterium]MDE6233027.1 DUF3881 family protein [Lachnospiraceae bacterium]MDE6251417.1 DUF3881 family protein [Lachnospiraceae bacterium]
MHSYLRPIGFSRYINKVRVNDIIKRVMEKPDYRNELMITTEETIFEFRKEFAEDMGIVVHGIVNEKQDYEIEYYFPYYNGKNVHVMEDISIEKNVAVSSYFGACEDVRLGVSLIFYLQNSMDYLEKILGGTGLSRYLPITLSAFALNGKVILPVKKTREDIQRNKSELKNRNKLIAAAKRGDESAMETLTVADLDTYTRISGRIMKEDVFSIVDSSFMPYGVSCDRYSIIGTIVEISDTINVITEEKIYKMTIDCNGITFDLAINKADIVGEPAIGRRFKGIIWMQGVIGF